MWQSPWDNAVPGGDQVTHAIWALATGGSFGTGLGFGDTRYLPAGHTDLILAAIGEELGAAGCFWLRAVRVPRLARLPHRTARAKRLRFLPRHRAHAVSDRAGADHGVRHPWRDAAHGVVTPFLSYGGSAMVANFCALGMLTAIRADRHPSGDLEPFRVPIMWLGSSLASVALVLLAVAVNVQMVHADDYIIRAHLGIRPTEDNVSNTTRACSISSG
jgi:Bacterial cell division membrane protein